MAGMESTVVGRTVALLALMTCAWSLGACSEQHVATTDVDHGAGAVNPVTATVVDDANVKGGTKTTLEVTTASLDGLRQDLGYLFGGVDANAEILVNPDYNPTGQVALVSCSLGMKHACLAATDRLSADVIRPFNPSATLKDDDPTREVNGLATTLEGIAVSDLSYDDVGNMDPKGIAATLSDLLPARADVQVEVKVDAADAAIETRAGKTGLWLPVDLDVVNPATRNHHCDDLSGFPNGDLPYCDEIVKAAEDHDCHAIDVTIQLNRIHLYIGFIPGKKANCDPYGPDADTAWMGNVPLGLDFHQPCLDVQVASDLGVSASRFGDGGDLELSAHVDTDFCAQYRTVECSVPGVDCDSLATDGALGQIQSHIAPLAGTLDTKLKAYLQSDGTGYKEPTPTVCGLADTSCWQALMKAAATEISYGWFANPFISRDYPLRHVPVLDVRHSVQCPSMPNVASQLNVPEQGPAYCLYCVEDPEAYGGYDCGPGPAPTSTLGFDYAVDTDHDGLDNLHDNCPDVPNTNPAQYQLDSDQDGIGDDCDSCPSSTVLPGDDKDGDCVADKVDNCPDDYNPDQANCNKHAEDALKLTPKGDVCDDMPCAPADTSTGIAIDAFSPCDPYATTCPNAAYVSDQGVDWRGVVDVREPGKYQDTTGITELAHCPCNAYGQFFDDKVEACKTSLTTGKDLCTIGRHKSYPGATGYAPDQSGWFAERTQTFTDACMAGKNCPIVQHETFPSAYALDPAYAGQVDTVWRFDQDLLLMLPPGTKLPQNEDELAAVDVGGLGWAHTPQFAKKDLATVALSSPVLADATWSDAASHYFAQDAGMIPEPIVVGLPSCPPGGCGFSAASFLDPVCTVCLKDRFPTWLIDQGNEIVQTSQRVTLDVTSHLDVTLTGMLRDTTSTLVAVSEPLALLQARGDYLPRAISVDNTSLQVNGYVLAGGGLVAGVNFLDYGFVDPPLPRVFAASGLEERVYGISEGPAGEQLVVIPLETTIPTLLPITGIATDGVPHSLVYRYRDRQLYLLDEDRDGRSSWLRIVRIDPWKGTATVLARTPYFRRHDALYLSVTSTGELLLAASARRPGTTLLMTLDPRESDVRLTSWLVERGTLAAPPDTRGDLGYGILTQDRAGKLHALDIPASTLHRPATSLPLPPWCD